MTSILDCLERGAEAHPDKTLYSFLDGFGREREHYTYVAFHERTRHLAQVLAIEKGLRRGDRVLLVYPPGLELIAAFFACARIGVIPVPVYPPTPMNLQSGLSKLTFVARDCEAVAVLTTPGLERSLRHRTPPLPELRWIATDGARGVAAPGFCNDPDPVLFLQYTSGSTSDPKGVVVTHANVIHNCDAVLDFVPTVVSWLPQYHDMGLIGYYLFPVVVGGTVHGFSPLDFLRRPALWLETISRVRASHTASPNFGYEYCLREDKIRNAELAGIDLSSLRVMMNAAEPVRPCTQERFLARFAPFGLRSDALVAAYGLAESTLAVAQHGRRAVTVNKKLLQQRTLRLEPAHGTSNNQIRLMSCGRPLSGVEVRIVDPEARTSLPEGRIGEIWTSGESTARGYWSLQASSGEVFGAVRADDPEALPRYMRTGDLGFLHEGELFVCGRIKDLIIVRGVNYYPQDIEAIAESASTKLRPGCVVAINAGPDGESLVVAAEVVSPRDLPDPAEIARAIRTQYYVEPHTIALVPHGAVPKTTSGKVSRAAARRSWLDGEMPVLASFTAGRDAAVSDPPAGLRQRFQYLVALYNLTGDEGATFAEIGIDSLTMVELLVDIKALLEEHGAGALVGAVDARLLSRLTIAEFFSWLDRLERASGEPIELLSRALTQRSQEHADHEEACMRADAELPPPLGSRAGPKAPLTDVLLTGATGFLGPFLLTSLLEQTPFTLHVLIRATDPAHGRDRIRAALVRSRLWTKHLEDALERRVRVVCGDLTRRDLGLGAEPWRTLAQQVQAIFHNGALVNYVRSYDALKTHNVDGTRELIRFAFAGAPKELHFVSSTFVHGWTSKNVLFELDNNDVMEHLDFGYSQSKWVAEQLVFAAGRRGLAVRVYRPSLISASADGVGSKDDIGVRLLAFMIRHGVAVDAHNQVSFLPVDVAAHNLATLFARRDLTATTFHVTVDAYYNMADVTREITRSHGYGFTYLAIPEFVAEMNRRSTRDDPIYPLLDFFNRSHTKIAGMAAKRYDNEAYRGARDSSPAARRDPSLSATVDYLMAFLLREGLIPSRPEVGSYGSTTTA